jgi:hypothetical protein
LLRAWFPPKVRINTGRLCPAGSGCHPLPDFLARMRPSDFLPPSVSAPVPLAFGLPRGRMLVLRRVTRAPATAFPLEMDIRLSISRSFPRGVCRISQVIGPSLPCAPKSSTTPGVFSPRPLSTRTLLPSGILDPWAPGNNRFRGRIPPAHTLVDLRITVAVTRHGARPYFRPAGLTL